jgi:hypothetical protein
MTEEPDMIASRLVGVTLLAAVVAIFASALVVWLLASRTASGGGRSDVVVVPIEPPTDPFSTTGLHEARRAVQRARLERGDRLADGRARMSIDLAIARYLARGRQ